MSSFRKIISCDVVTVTLINMLGFGIIIHHTFEHMKLFQIKMDCSVKECKYKLNIKKNGENYKADRNWCLYLSMSLCVM